LETLAAGRHPARRWCLIACVALTALGGWFAYRAVNLPEPLATIAPNLIRVGKSLQLAASPEALAECISNFQRTNLTAAAFCCVGVCGWFVLANYRPARFAVLPIAGLLLVGELLVFAVGVNPQCEPKLYFPRLPFVDQIQQHPTARTMACNGLLPVDLNMFYGWDEVCGYDAVDPRSMIEVLRLARAPDAVQAESIDR
jgi:hypothetical protein